MNKNITLLIVIVFFGLGLFIYVKYLQKPKNSTSWPLSEKEKYFNECLIGLDGTAIEYPDFGKEYCECSVSSIMKSMTYDQYNDLLRKTKDEQMKTIMPLIQGCLDKLVFKIDSMKRIEK